MGDPGQNHNTTDLSVPDIDGDASSPRIPAFPSEKQFTLHMRLLNTSNSAQNIRISSVKQKMTTCLIAGDATRTLVGLVEPGSSIDFSLDFFPLVKGVLKVTGLRVLDLVSGAEKEIENLLDVFIF